ncbi:retrovirus-related pol polyprotein from transposon TNT 1-94 [Tanacetum coccineum]
MSKQCTKPKRKRDDSWFKDKVFLVQAQANGQILHEEELAFLANPGTTKVDLLANLSHYGTNALVEVHNPDNVDNNMINQGVQVIPSSEQSNVVNHSETEITSDSNIIPYSQYVIESQQAVINLDNKSVNDTLTVELERYKEQVKVLKEGQNIDLKSKDNVSDSSTQSVEIDRLKQTLFKHLKENESLMQTVTLLKNDFKKEESRNIYKEIALEKRIKQLHNIVFKRDQSAQTVHILTKPQFFYDHTTKQSLGFQNPFYLKKAQQLEPKLYDGNVIKNTSSIVSLDSEETLMLAEESRSKMILKQQDPMMLEKKVNTTPVDYAEQGLTVTTLKDELKKIKGKCLADNVVRKHTIDPEILKIDVEYLNPRLLNNRSAHSDYLKHTQEEAEFLIIVGQTCPSINNSSEKLVAVTPKNKDKRVRFTKPVTSSENTNTKTASSSNLVSNKPMLSSTGVKPSTSASGSQPSGNPKKDKIQQTPSSTQKNKVEAHLRIVKSSLKNKNSVVEPKGTANVKHSKLNANSKLLCVKCNGCMLSDNHDLYVLDFINDVNVRNKSKSVKKSSIRKVWKPTGKVFTNIGYTWRPTSRTFTVVENACPLTRITTTAEVPLRKPTTLESDIPKTVVTLVYSRKAKKSKTNVPVSKPKNIKSLSANKKEPSKSWGSIVFDVPSSSLDECRSSKLFSGTIKFRNDHVAKILGYGDYQIGNVTILRVYYVEGFGHNLFSVGQLCDSNLKVAFCQQTCFIRNLEGVDLLTRSRGNNVYSLSLGDMMASSPIYLLSKASKTKSWLWHRCLSHLNFSSINHIARHDLVRGLPKLKFEKDHLYSACAIGKSKKKPHKPKSEDTN